MQDIGMDVFKKWYADHEKKIIEDFFTFLSFPSISTDPLHAKDVRKCADWLKGYLTDIGLDVQIWETTGHPIVFATHLKAGPNRPTVLIYHHYDVQPVDPLELWKSDPFKPEVRDGQVYARGAVDNKGQCFYSLTALKALFELADSLHLNIKILIEGEEESGGKGTYGAIYEKKELLQADHLLVVDFGIPSLHVPAVTLGSRGIIALEVVCQNSSIDLHSGEHGGIALNPNRALVDLLSQIWDRDGKVAIPHFYEGIETLSPEHLDLLDLSFDKVQYEKDFGVKAYSSEKGFSERQANWLRPTVEINGIWGGYTGKGFKTVIPSSSHAKISCRLVPKQNPEKIVQRFTAFLKEKVAKGIDLQVHIHSQAAAYRSGFDSSIVKTAALVYEEVFGMNCRYILCGGSVPIVGDLAEISGADVAMIGVGLADDAIHAPNEHFGLDRLKVGFLIMAGTLSRLGKDR
ncbi:MAG: dipeptidase [Chlamydiales bacterium]|nr:dipeptidase [Chlamydiales bacterium]